MRTASSAPVAGDDAGDADVGRADDADIDPAAGQGAEHRAA